MAKTNRWIHSLVLWLGSHLTLSLHPSNEPTSLLHWLCHNYSTINTVMVVKFTTWSTANWKL